MQKQHTRNDRRSEICLSYQNERFRGQQTSVTTPKLKIHVSMYSTHCAHAYAHCLPLWQIMFRCYTYSCRLQNSRNGTSRKTDPLQKGTIFNLFYLKSLSRVWLVRIGQVVEKKGRLEISCYLRCDRVTCKTDRFLWTHESLSASRNLRKMCLTVSMMLTLASLHGRARTRGVSALVADTVRLFSCSKQLGAASQRPSTLSTATSSQRRRRRLIQTTRVHLGSAGWQLRVLALRQLQQMALWKRDLSCAGALLFLETRNQPILTPTD